MADSNIDEKYELLLNYLGPEKFLEELVRSLDFDECDSSYDFIARMWDIEFNKKRSPTAKLPKIGDEIYTPRFLYVPIKEVFSTYEEMVAAGYTEPTHFKGDFEIQGKSRDMYHMSFAASPLSDWKLKRMNSPNVKKPRTKAKTPVRSNSASSKARKPAKTPARSKSKPVSKTRRVR